MPGAETVYQRAGNTGGAAVLGGTSWDPIAAVKYAGALKQAQDQAKTLADQKKKDALFKDLTIKPGKTLAEDRNAINNFGDDFLNYRAKLILGEGRDFNQSDYNEGLRMKQEFDQLQNDSNQQDIALNTYLGQTKGNLGKLDVDAMTENGAKFSKPELYMDDPYIQQTFTPILEYYMQDPFYGQDPERALVAAKTHWRNDYGRDYITEPILNDESLLEDYKQNVLPLASEWKNYKSVRTADGTVITDDNAYLLQEDTPVTVEMQDGTTQDIILKGTRSVTLQRYDDAPTIKKSADNQFNKQDDNVKQNYIDQYGDDAAKEWYADTYSGFGLKGSTKTTTQAPLPKEGRYGYGKKTYPFEVSLDEGDHNYNRAGQWETDKGNKITMAWASVPIRGVSFGNDKNKLPIVTVNPQRIFNQNNFSWVKDRSQYGQDLDFKVSGVYEMPAITEEINLADPKYKPFMDWAKTQYGGKTHTGLQKLIYVGGDPKKGLNKEIIVSSDTPLSREEAKELKKINPNLVSSRKFATGEINGTNETTGDKLYIQGATIPYDEVSTQINAATNNTDWGMELEGEYGTDQNWWDDSPVINKETKTEEKTNTKVDVVNDIKDQIKTGGGRTTWD